MREVAQYDNYLNGNCWGYTLYREAGEDENFGWIEIDSCWGFLGEDRLDSDNEMIDSIGYGLGETLAEALDNNEYEIGEAVNHVTHTTSFEF